MIEPAPLRGERTAAAVLLATGPAAAFVTVSVCLVAAVLVPLGWWRPVVVVPVLALALVGAGWLTRQVPVRGGPDVPVWTAVACVVIAVAFGVWAGATHGEHLVLRRDAGSYALFAHWLATHHGLPVPADLPAFGGSQALAVPGFTLDSPAYYQVLSGSGNGTTATIVPQFLLGAPALFSIGWWLAGWTGVFAAPAVLGAFAVLAAGGLAARLVGPRWAPLAAGGLALTQPMLHAGRTTFSEPPATLLVLAAACLAADALDPRGADRVRRLAVLAGLLLGLAGLVRIDSVREVALLVPVCAALRIRRHPSGVPMAVAALVAAAVAAVPAVALSRPYLRTVSASLRPLVIATVALTVLAVAVVAGHDLLDRRATGRARTGGSDRADRGRAARAFRSRRLDRVLPVAGAAAVVLVGVALATRPLWTIARQSPDDPGDALVASLQRQQGLPVDGARTYAEQSVRWVVWYTGWPAAVAALLTLAAAAALAVRWWRNGGPVRSWTVPAFVGAGSVALTLYRPGITPDHPWADRRLVPVVLPVVVVAATAAAAWGVRFARRRMPAGILALVAVVAVLAVAVPPALATWPLAARRTEVGEPAAATAVCAALHPGDVVVGVADAQGGIRAQNEWVQVIRGVCGYPSAALLTRPRAERVAALDRLAALAAGAGRQLVVLAAGESDATTAGALTELGQAPRRATLLHTREDQHLLMRRPSSRDSLVIDVWLAVWRPASGG